jgi:FkbM family methyltransferase
MKRYNYFNDSSYPIDVTLDTVLITPFTFQVSELWENKSLKQFYGNIDKEKEVVIVDIGAQSGLYSLYAKFLPKSKYYSYEPYKDTFDLLNDNIRLNGLEDRINTFNYGLSDKCDMITFNVCKSHNGLHTMGSNLIRFPKDDCDSIKVIVSTLDEEFYNKGIKVDYIKIDTEGWEYKILLGGLNTLREYKPVIQLEWNKLNMFQCGVNENELRLLLISLGYVEISHVEEEKLFMVK